MKNKKLTRLIIALIVMAVIIPVAIGVGAAEIAGLKSGISSSGFSSFITFYNAKIEETAFYVQKVVEQDENGYPVPEGDEFEFTLKLNGEVARDKQYILYNADGQRIYVYDGVQTTEEDTEKFEDLLTTDRYGHFYLQDGQMAKFEGVRTGDKYEVTESEAEGYQLVYPASESRSLQGYIPYEGEKVTFRNKYGEALSGIVQVTKRVALPAGFETPETPGFTFRIYVENEPWANKEFDIMSVSTGEKLGTGTTDSEGKYELHGDTYAVFKDIPEDVDYQIEELISASDTEEGWNVIGSGVQEGATGEGTGASVDFTNAQASFGVSKSMFADAGCEESFGFQIFDAEGKNPFEGPLQYYLYDAAGELVSDELYSTTDDCKFELMAGQTAMFIVQPGITVSVREIDSKGYPILMPEGYEAIGVEIPDWPIVIPFVNVAYPDGSLDGSVMTVRKIVEDESNGNSVPDVEFTMRLLRKAEDSDEYEPVPDASYSIQTLDGAETHTTDEKGWFYLRDGQTAMFTGLDEGYEYKVEEVEEEMPSGFRLTDENPPGQQVGETPVGVEIVNTYYGGRIPFVGGIGTKMFYIIGAILIAAAAAVLAYRYKKNKAASGS